jgi:alcohol dehydrogenase, propanol-preferring
MPPQPGFQSAAWLPKAGPGATLEIRHDIEIPNPKSGQVLVKLECSGICHSDVHSIYNETPMETDIAGHEGVGNVVKLGPGVPDDFMGARVGIKWQYSTCGECEICPVDETACPNQDNSGRNVRGTFAQYIAAPAKDVTRLPKELKSEILAPLLCAGLAMYSSISKAKLNPGNWLVLPGAGGGLGHLGLQIAKFRGYKVIAIDSGEEKRKMCLDLGATVFLDFKTDNIEEEVKRLTNGYGAHAVVVSVGSTAAYTEGFKLLRRLGTLICVGIPRTDFDLPISPFMMIVRCLRVVGSSCGTRQEIDELLKIAVAGEVVPHVQVYELEEINTIVKKLANFEIGGRVVLKIPQ